MELSPDGDRVLLSYMHGIELWGTALPPERAPDLDD